MTKVLINEKLVEENEANVPYNDRGYNFGDGIYEYVRVYNNRLFTARPHFERLLRSADEIGLELNYTVDGLIELVQELISANKVVTFQAEKAAGMLNAGNEIVNMHSHLIQRGRRSKMINVYVCRER